MDKGFAAFSTMQSPVMIPFNYSYAALSVNVSLPPRAVPYSHYIGMVPPPPPPPQLLALPAAPASSPETTVSTSGSPTPTRSPSTAMKSFSIEAILGLNSQADAHRQQQQLQYQYPAACHPQYRSLPDITSVYPGHYHQGMHATYPGNLPLSPSNQQQEHHGVFKQQNIAGKANLGAQRRHHRLDVISRSYPQLKTETAAHTPDTKTKGKSCKVS
ncbi:PREDICTED: uncharacterized protein LOC106809557 [Priapulus caudatus]|uniref:Uncharacterized protein LOC106809557 n=1 Tax=Priapulus caudatus TaxID=37621 RepID=A0ABM1E7J4_PRICU|nr:PREDICTED: uncharacterized protein LOC106809557 [Priapulus caudatus]